MIAIKLFFRNETRRAQIYTASNDITFALLVSTAQNLFPALRGKSNLEFYWKDEDDDTIVVSSDEELVEATRIMSNDNRKVMRFEIRENIDGELLTSYPVPEASIAREVNMAVHSNVRCDCCDVSPIVGTRYKCAVREDYDLCEQCEAKEVQPHPMIKINTPDQAPAAILIAVKDEQGSRVPWRGPHHRGHGGHHHHGHHHHPHEGPHPPGPPPHFMPHGRNPFGHPEGACGAGPQCGPGQYWRRMMRQNERRAAEAASQAQSQSGWIATAEAFAKSLSSDLSAFTNGPQSDEVGASSQRLDDSATIDQDFLEEAVRQSLEGSAKCAAAATAVAIDSLDVPVTAVSIPSAVASAPVVSVPLSKPMARFVRDVTFPDGTSVQPGSVFLKTWRIRNDGAHRWPDNVVLTCAGGDSLSAGDVELPVDSLSAGSEAEITLQLSAPERTGRHVAYFRMRTTEGVFFGQRLWADIRVVDDDQGWHLLGGMLATAVPSPTETQVATLHSSNVSEKPTSNDVFMDCIPEQSDANLPAEATAAAAVDDNDMGSSHSSVVAVWTRVWAKELSMLNEMGFSDSTLAFDLLREHLGVPASLSSADSHVSPEGMQNVISALLAEQDGN